jgi:DNA replication and repair protein RecF
MQVEAVTLRDFRSYADARADIGPALSVITGPNGVGKTNLIEALYFGCTGRSCRTANDREMVRFGAPATRVVVTARGEDGAHELAVGFAPGEQKRMRFDGALVERLLDVPDRPLISVFLPDRLELVKGPPALRRAHLDQFVAALWPARAATRRAYAQALAQRNALIARVRRGVGSRAALPGWDLQLARLGIALMDDRRRAAGALGAIYPRVSGELGLDGEPSVAYRPRSRAAAAEELAEELAERTDGDLERGFTGHGPHRDDLALVRDGRDLRTYGSQGQQRLGLLALLLAEREVLGDVRGQMPLMLLDDVMSELDADRRRVLVAALREGPGQAVITATDLEHVPGGADAEVTRLQVAGGAIHVAAPAVA